MASVNFDFPTNYGAALVRTAALAERNLLVCVALVSVSVSVPAEPPGPPAPIGTELMSFTTALGVPGCAEAHLYRAREHVQLQCFASDGTFSWENHGVLSDAGADELEAALATVDLMNTTISDDGLCNASEQSAATVTLWIDARPVSYTGCPSEGVRPYHDAAMLLVGDISDCTDLDLLESVESGCRAY